MASDDADDGQSRRSRLPAGRIAAPRCGGPSSHPFETCRRSDRTLTIGEPHSTRAHGRFPEWTRRVVQLAAAATVGHDCVRVGRRRTWSSGGADRAGRAQLVKRLGRSSRARSAAAARGSVRCRVRRDVRRPRTFRYRTREACTCTRDVNVVSRHEARARLRAPSRTCRAPRASCRHVTWRSAFVQ
jgi:hypothetical protein